MHSVVLLWAPDSAENRRVIDTVSQAFEQENVRLTVQSAAAASITSITAADIVVFGVQKVGSAETPAEFSDLIRIFKGISLAGRTAGLFSLGPERATSKLRKALKDTEMTVNEEDPVFTDQKQNTPPSVSEWAHRLVAAHQGMFHGRA